MLSFAGELRKCLLAACDWMYALNWVTNSLSKGVVSPNAPLGIASKGSSVWRHTGPFLRSGFTKMPPLEVTCMRGVSHVSVRRYIGQFKKGAFHNVPSRGHF